MASGHGHFLRYEARRQSLFTLIAQEEAAADRGVAALAMEAATSAKRINYALGIATTLSLAATVVAVVRCGRS